MSSPTKNWEKLRQGYGATSPIRGRRRRSVPTDLPEEVKQWLESVQKSNESSNHSISTPTQDVDAKT